SVIINFDIMFTLAASTGRFTTPENTGCACLGTVLTYTCTAVGTGNTLWEGTAFDCFENGNGIILRH
ncbi:hypothetical protein AB9K17_24250, partial [Salmonella enterica subsp. enterica serovar Kentucky]|uniref:hypothetical protein n=1 Tax=Salmonella enterica TaxID=28901 RepID=UPI003F4B4A60